MKRGLNAFNPLPNHKILDLSRMKAFADNNKNVSQKWKVALERIVNNCGERIKCWLFLVDCTKIMSKFSEIHNFSHALMKRGLNAFNPLPNHKILDLSKMKAFADNNKNVSQKWKVALERIVNNCGERRKCWFPAILPFPTMFSKAFFLRVIKSHYLLLSQTSPDFYVSAVKVF